MGMFDYFNVHIDLLKNVDESLLSYIKKINDDQDYANFQTKSLENCLTEYTLDDDGQLFERSTFMYDDMEHSATKTADAKVNLNALGSSGYVAGGPQVWIDGANQIIKKK